MKYFQLNIYICKKVHIHYKSPRGRSYMTPFFSTNKYMMTRILKYIWQLPQNILGLLVVLFTQAKKDGDYYVTTKYNMGVSLGNYIIFGKMHVQNRNRLLHEKGHQKQSLFLGPLYLLVIGLPSISGNIFDRIFHKTWPYEKRMKWYYGQPWEKWANDLVGISIQGF